MERYEKLFDAVGWIGFALLTPVALYLFGVQSAVPHGGGQYVPMVYHIGDVYALAVGMVG